LTPLLPCPSAPGPPSSRWGNGGGRHNHTGEDERKHELNPENHKNEKENGAAHLSLGVDVDIIFGSVRVRNERLYQELPEHTHDALDLLRLACASRNPGLRLGPGLVQGQEAALASPLDELVGLRDELGSGDQQPRVGDLGLVEDVGDLGVLGEVERGQPRGRVVRGRPGQRRWLDDGGAGEVVVDDGLAVGLADGFGRHRGCGRGERRRRKRRVKDEVADEREVSSDCCTLQISTSSCMDVYRCFVFFVSGWVCFLLMLLSFLLAPNPSLASAN
jgi:hypothetical protein